MAGAALAQDGRVSEHEFGKALLGCWGSEWHASLIDGRETGGTDLVCFDAAGGVSTRSEMFGDVRGRYHLASGKLHVAADSTSSGWLLGAAQMSCDAAIKPGEHLNLTGCRGNPVSSSGAVGTVEDLPDFWFSAEAAE